MLIQVSETLYLNTDTIESIEYKNTLRSEYVEVTTTSHYTHSISKDVAGMLIQLMQGIDPFSLGKNIQEDPSQSPLDIKTRTVIALRDELPQGATVEELVNFLDADYSDVNDSLTQLCAEYIAAALIVEKRGVVYFHAMHKPKEPTPGLLTLATETVKALRAATIPSLDPSAATSSPSLLPEANSELKADR